MISAAKRVPRASAEKATISGSRPLSRASVEDPQALGEEQPFGPTAFLSRSERSSLTVELEKAVTWRGIILPRTAPRPARQACRARPRRRCLRRG